MFIVFPGESLRQKNLGGAEVCMECLWTIPEKLEFSWLGLSNVDFNRRLVQITRSFEGEILGFFHESNGLFQIKIGNITLGYFDEKRPKLKVLPRYRVVRSYDFLELLI